MYREKIAKKALGIPLVRNVINWYKVLGVNAIGGVSNFKPFSDWKL